MNEDFVTYELAVKLKEKGFDVPFYFYYRTDDKLIHHAMVTKPLVYCDKIDDEVVCAPTISQVLRLLRKKKIVVSILPTGYNKETGLPGYYYVIYDVAEYSWKKYEYPQSFETWEECELGAIEYALDNLI